jgi:hypothetical protein
LDVYLPARSLTRAHILSAVGCLHSDRSLEENGKRCGVGKSSKQAGRFSRGHCNGALSRSVYLGVLYIAESRIVRKCLTEIWNPSVFSGIWTSPLTLCNTDPRVSQSRAKFWILEVNLTLEDWEVVVPKSDNC